MSRQNTKQELADSFIDLASKMSFEQITVSAVARNCNKSRQAFYYHFADLHELAAWIVHQKVLAALGPNISNITWQEGLLSVLKALKANSDLIEKMSSPVTRPMLEQLFEDEFAVLAMRLVEDQAAGRDVAPSNRALIARFYAAGFAEIVEAWIEGGMREDPNELARRLEVLIQGGVPEALARFDSL